MRALLLTDIQNDFLPEGALPVPGGDEVVPVANQLQSHFSVVVATQDWHPANHRSFAVNHPGRRVYEQIQLHGQLQRLWPVHCVADTPGAELAPGLHTQRLARVFHKGVDPEIDSYSAFFDNRHLRSTGLGEWLKNRGVEEVYLAGLATDYCVKFSALDALRFEFKVFLVEDACRGINLQRRDVEQAISEMKQAGVCLVRSGQLGF